MSFRTKNPDLEGNFMFPSTKELMNENPEELMDLYNMAFEEAKGE